MIEEFPPEDQRFMMLRERAAEPAMLAPLPCFSTQVQRLVHFSETSTMIITERATDDEIKRKWLSEEEEAAIQHEFKQQVQAMMMRKTSSSPRAQLDPEDLYECIGMEKFLSNDICTKSALKRRMHIHKILSAQDRQRKMGVCTPELLSMISERSSEWTVARSHAIASKYWGIFES